MPNGDFQAAFEKHLLPRLEKTRARDEVSEFVLREMNETWRGSLADAVQDAIEQFSASETLRLRTWVDEAGGFPRERREEADEQAADELLVYLDNEEDIYRLKQAIAENLLKKIKRGTYDHSFAQRAWEPAVERAAKKYVREFSVGSDWAAMFVPATRDLVAKELADRWYENAKDGRPDEV